MYAQPADGLVNAAYFIPIFGNRRRCNDLSRRRSEITKVEFYAAQALVCPVPQGMRAGDRLWVDDDQVLPVINDAGCTLVHVSFDANKHKFNKIACEQEF